MLSPAISSPTLRTVHRAAVRPYTALAAIMLIAFAIWVAALGEPAFPLDDAYITLHNADVLLRGVDANYGVSPLVGATSPVHLLLVAALASALGLAWAGAAASWLAAGAYLAGLMFVARSQRLSPLETGALLLAGALAGFFTCHLLNGLETGLAMALVVWAVALALAPRGPALPLLLGLMPFVRPELAVLSAVLAADRALARWRAGEARALVSDAVLIGLAAAPWLVWMAVETGALLPQTASAKRHFFADDQWAPGAKLWFVVTCVVKAMVQIGPLAFGLVGLLIVRPGRAALLAAAGILALYAAFFPLGASHNQYRYLYALAPLCPLGLALALGHMTGTLRLWFTRLLAAGAAWAIVFSAMMLGAYADALAFTRKELAGVAVWIDTNLPPEARIAVHDAGYIAYATDRKLTDIVGLKTPFARAIHAAAPGGRDGRVVAIGQVLLQSRSDHLVVLKSWDDGAAITGGLIRQGWKVETLREGAYHVVRLTPPSGAAR